MACRGLLLEEPNRAVETAGDHCLSCDNDAAAEKWIRSTCSPAVCVKDLKEMEDSVVRDTITRLGPFNKLGPFGFGASTLTFVIHIYIYIHTHVMHTCARARKNKHLGKIKPNNMHWEKLNRKICTRAGLKKALVV